jgi:DNA replication and repair protein RecF
MPLLNFQLYDFRNFSFFELTLSPKCNLFYGKNGSGKTSILEAIYFLGFGRSFRSRLLRNVIKHGADKFALAGKVGAACTVMEYDQTIAIGIEKLLDGSGRLRIAGENASSSAEFAKILPIQLINQNSFRLLEAGPKARRQFLDWGVFHVEQSFLSDWRKAERILQQRSSILRNNGALGGLKLWDNELESFAGRLHEARQKYILLFLPILSEVLSVLLPNIRISCDYLPGWDISKSFHEVLEANFIRDCKVGYTNQGPHRADLLFHVNGRAVYDLLSRGQQKMFLIALCLAQGVLLSKQASKKCIFLIDDLGAELDNERRMMVARYLLGMDAQIFVTDLDKDRFIGFDSAADAEMFHVEHLSPI